MQVVEVVDVSLMMVVVVVPMVVVRLGQNQIVVPLWARADIPVGLGWVGHCITTDAARHLIMVTCGVEPPESQQIAKLVACYVLMCGVWNTNFFLIRCHMSQPLTPNPLLHLGQVAIRPTWWLGKSCAP